MGQNFIAADREQVLLMPSALVDWLPDEHFVWTVIGAVEQMDLGAFYGAYRANGQGRAAYDPQVMLSLLLYAYATGVSSSRQIERCCEVDVAFKLITAMRVPDHSTIAEFRRRHQDAISEVFVQVLALCAEAGLVKVGVIAIDGTKIAANASRDAGRSYVSIVEELLADAEQADQVEDQRHGSDRGDEPPAGLRSRDERRQTLAEAKARLEAQREQQLQSGETTGFETGIELDVEQLQRRRQGRRSWQRERLISSTRTASVRPLRSLAVDATDSRTPSDVWSKSWQSAPPLTTPTSSFIKAAGTRWGGGSARSPSRTRRRCCRTGWSISPIPTRG